MQEGWSPTRIAAGNGHAHVVSILLRKKADVDSSDIVR